MKEIVYIKKSIIDNIETIAQYIQKEEGGETKAIVGILVKKPTQQYIEQIIPILRDRKQGCKWFPQLTMGNISNTLSCIIRGNRKICGMVLITVYDKNSFTKPREKNMITLLYQTMQKRNLINSKYVYMLRVNNVLIATRLNKSCATPLNIKIKENANGRNSRSNRKSVPKTA